MGLGMEDLIELRICCRGFPLLYILHGLVVVWIRLSGSLQHFHELTWEITIFD